MKKLIKKIILKVFFGNSFVRKGVKFGKGSYIREHAQICGGKRITLGSHTRIFPYSRIQCFEYVSGKHLSPKLTIGDNVYMGRNTTILCANEVTIGDNAMFASYCFVSDENHGMDLSSGVRYECQPIEFSSVHIGKNCWIGEKAMIMPGVTIGDNTIIGAGSVVTKSIPENSIAVGNPAKVIKKYNFETNQWERC